VPLAVNLVSFFPDDDIGALKLVKTYIIVCQCQIFDRFDKKKFKCSKKVFLQDAIDKDKKN
jgi:hypothetical protein